jgi:hypothetical protein
MSDIKNAFEAITAKTEEYHRADAYYDGTNKEVFANQRWFRMFRYEGSDFRFNFSKTVVDSVLNRLEVAQVQTTSASADAYINQIWEQTDLKIDMNEIHRKALVYGDCYAIVWPDMNGQLAIDYNSPLHTTIVYDEENPRIKSYAAKMWQITQSDKKIIRLNMYYTDRIEKYESMGDLEVITHAPDFALTEVIPNPWGEIPVFHFRTNKPFGRPEHADAYGPQDAINKLISTHMYTVDYQGAPQRYALSNGGNANEFEDFSEDDTARENLGALQNGPGQLWYLQGVSAVGQFAAADPDTFTKPVIEFVNAMAAITSTPTHYFAKGSYIPSGEALRVSEAPLTKKVLNRQLAFGSAWRDLFKFMIRVEGIQADVEITWKSAETVDSVDSWDIAVRKKSVGMPLEQILLELGYDAEIAAQVAEASAAATAPQTGPTEVALRGTGLNSNNLALQQAAAERDNQTGQI